MHAATLNSYPMRIMELLENSAAEEGTGTRRLARVYAEALLAVAEKRDAVDSVGDELASLVNRVLNVNPDFEKLLASRGIQRTKKTAILIDAFQGKTSDLLFDFLTVVNSKDRLDLLRAIAVAYRELYDVRAKRIQVMVRSAVALDEAQQRELRETLQASLQLEPVLILKIDPELLGGMIVQVGDHVFDSSVRSRIENLRTQLLARSSYEIQTGRDRFSSN